MMNVTKKFFITSLLAISTLVATTANAYVGPWEYDARGGEYMVLGDGMGSGLELYGTTGWCSQAGASYSKMHRILDDAKDFGGGWIAWSIDRTCDDGYNSYVRVCLKNLYGASACSTYLDNGWVEY